MIYEQRAEVIYDSGQAVQGVVDLTQAIAAQTKAIQNIEKVTVRWDKSGKQIDTTITGVDDTMNRYTQTLTKLKDGTEALTVATIQFNEAKERQKKADFVENAVIKANEQRLRLDEAEAYRINKQLNDAEIANKKQEQIINESIARRKADQIRFDESEARRLNAKYDRDTKLFQKFLEKQRQEQIRYNNTLRAQGTTSQFIGENFSGLDLTNFSDKRVTTLNAALNELRQRLIDNHIPVQRLTALYRQLQNGFVVARNATEANLIPALNRVTAAHRTAMDSVSKYASTFTLSWTSLARLTAIQYIHRIIASINRLFIEGIRAAFDYANKLSLIQTLTLRNNQDTIAWGESIYRVSNIYGSSLLDTADAFYEAVSNQISETTEDTERFIETTLKLSRVTQATARDSGQAIAGVINAFNFNAAQASRVAAVLFKVVDLGSLTIGEIADRLGRAAPLAKTLNISFEELAATLATFTIEGRKADASITLLRNIELKLTKPTKDMAALLKSWGFESGQTALAVLGFEEILTRFNRILNSEGLPAIAKYFNELRALEGITSASGTGFEKIVSAIREMEGATVDFNEAFKRTQTPLRLLQIEFNKVKNFFIHDVGTQVANILQKLNKDMGGFSGVIRDTVNALRTGFAAQILTNLGGLGKALFGARTAFSLLITVVEVFTARFIALKLTLGATIGTLHALSAAGKITEATFLSWSNKLTNALNIISLALIGISLAISAQRQKYLATFTIAQEQLEKVTDKWEALTEAIESNQEVFNRAQRKRLQFGEAAANEYVARLVKDYDKEQELALENVRNVEQFIEASLKGRVATYEAYLRKLTDMIDAAGKRIQDNEKLIQQLEERARRNDFDFLQQFRSKSQQVRAIIERVTELRKQLSDASSADNIKSLSDEILDLIRNAQGLSNRRTAIQLQQTYRDVVKDTTSKIKDLNAEEQKRIDVLEKQRQADAQRLRQIRVLTTEALKFKLVDKENQLINNDPEQAKREILDVIGKIDSLIKAMPDIANFDDLINLRQSLQKDLDEFGDQIDIKDKIVNEIDAIYKALTESQIKFSDEFTKSIKDIFGVTLTGTVKDGQREIAQLYEDLKNQFEDLSAAEAKAKIAFERSPDVTSASIAQIIAQLEVAKPRGLTAAERIANRETINKEIKSLTDAQEAFFKAGSITLDELLNVLKDTFRRTRNSFAITDDNTKLVDSLRKQVEIVANQITVAEQFEKAKTDLSQFMKTLEKVEGLREKIISNFELEQKSRASNIEALDRNTNALGLFNPNINGKPLLNGTAGNATAAGVNVGGITITVNESSNPQLTAQQVALQLERSIRRGVIRPLA